MFTGTDWMQTSRRIVAVAGLLATLAGCGGTTSARDAAVDRAVDDGLERELAECVVDAVAAEFGEEALAEDYETTPAELDQMFEITGGCLFSE